MPIIRRCNSVRLPIVVCPVVAVVMLESQVARCVHSVENVACLRQATFSTLCTYLATRLFCFGIHFSAILGSLSSAIP